MSDAILLPVLPFRNLRAWPRYEAGIAIAYRPATDALRVDYPTDAHTAAYSVPGLERRLDKGAAGYPLEGSPLAVPMVALFVDIDGADHKADPTWRTAEAAKVARALAAHPGGFCYQTRGGYRLVWRLAAPFPITSADDAARWRVFYWRTLLHLSRRFDLVGDPACADWTRLYRLPHATRDPGAAPEALPTEGDSSLSTPWTFEPSDSDLGADLAEARRLLALLPAMVDDAGRTKLAAPWSAAVKALAIAAGETPEPKALPPRPEPAAAEATDRPGRPGIEQRERLWCERAIDRMSSEVASLGRGSRNNAARDAALVLGHYAPHILDPSAIESALLRACEVNGLVRDDGRAGALTTIRRAIADGMAEPKRPDLTADEPATPPPTTTPAASARPVVAAEVETIDAEDDNADPDLPPALDRLVEPAFLMIDRRQRREEQPIPTPWPDFNAQLQRGFWPGVHVLISGTGAGKSQLAIQAALAAVEAPGEQRAAVGYVALELDENQVLARLIGLKTRLDWSSVYRGDLTDDEMGLATSALGDLHPLPFHIDAGTPAGWPGQRIYKMTAALRRWYGPSRPLLVVVDFLQLVGSDLDENGRARREEMRERFGRAAYTARQAAREFNAAIVLISSTARANYRLIGKDGAINAAGLTCDDGRRCILSPDPLVGLGKETGEIEYAADSLTVLARVPADKWQASDAEKHGDRYLRPVIVATPKLRIGPASWSVLGFTGSSFHPWPTDPMQVIRAIAIKDDDHNPSENGAGLLGDNGTRAAVKKNGASKATEKGGRYD